MAAGDTLRRINQQDQWILNFLGNLVGIKNPNASGADLRIDAMPQLLAQFGAPIILPSSGSSNATGLITLTTALPYQPSGVVQVWLPAGVVVGDATGGLYSATFSSTTVCQLAGAPTTANAAYTQVTTAVTLASLTVPGNVMGANGMLRVAPHWSVPGNANTKTGTVMFGGVTFGGLSNTTNISDSREIRIRNRGALNVNIGFVHCSAQNFAPIYRVVDTGQNQALALMATLSVATDYMILEGGAVDLVYSA